MKGKDFIITGLQSWDIPIGSNAIDIAKEISLNNRVLYVNSPLDMMTLYRNKPTPETRRRLEVLKKQKSPIRKISDSLWVLDCPFYVWSINGLPDGFLFDAFNKANNKKIFSYIIESKFTADFTNIDIVNQILQDYSNSSMSEPYWFWNRQTKATQVWNLLVICIWWDIMKSGNNQVNIL